MKVRSSKFEVRSSIAILLLLPASLLAQQRDTTAKPTVVAGTAEISGTVVTADASPQPLRRVVVTLTGGVPTPRAVLTDDAGRFVFAGLPEGSFVVTARKAAYLAAPYGAKRPGRTGSSIALAAGQKENVTITMHRGAAVSGTLRDSNGGPLAGVDVRAIEMRAFLANPDAAAYEMGATDDRGMYRIYSLVPGDYVIAALPGTLGTGLMGAPSIAELDAALSTLAARKVGAAPSSPANPPAPMQPRPIGFGLVFYPGTAFLNEATRIKLAAGDDRAGIDFTVKALPVASIEGIVSGSVSNLATVNVSLIPMGPRVVTGMSSSQLSGRAIDSEGKFQYSNLAPGQYRIVARAQQGGVDTSGPPPGSIVNGAQIGGGGGRGAPPVAGQQANTATDYLYGFADIDLRGEDVSDLGLALQPGGVISGRVVFSGNPATKKPDDLSNVRVAVSYEGSMGTVTAGNGMRMGTGNVTQSIPTMRPDGTFEIHGIAPGQFRLSATLPADVAKSWHLRSVMSGDKDVLDESLTLGPGIKVSDLTVTFADAPTEIAGSLQSASGQSTSDYYIVVMTTDRSQWRPRSRRIVSARPSTNGRFTFSNLPAGEYVIAALSDLDPLDLTEASFLEQIVPAGVKVTLNEGEKKVQDLRIK
jgi:Carboxypeptidase regulatory-like domain